MLGNTNRISKLVASGPPGFGDYLKARLSGESIKLLERSLSAGNAEAVLEDLMALARDGDFPRASDRVPEALRLMAAKFEPVLMVDNVRRGGELVGGQGGAAPDYAFATLYRLRRWQNGRLEAFFEGGKFLGQSDPLGQTLGLA